MVVHKRRRRRGVLVARGGGAYQSLQPGRLLMPTKRLNAPSTLLGSITVRERRKLARRDTHTHYRQHQWKLTLR